MKLNKSFRSIWLSSATSELGGAFFTFCNSILIYEHTGSATALGLVWLIYYIPSFFMQLFIGPYIDRWSRKYTMIWCQLIRAILAMLLAITLFSDWFSVSLIYMVQVIDGLIMPIFTPANQSILPTIVEKEFLGKANASLESIRQVMAVMGPISAGVLADFIEVDWLLIIISIAFLLSTYNLLQINERPLEQEIRKTWIEEFKDGLNSYFEQPLIVWLGVFFGFVQFGVGVTIVTTLPYITTILEQPTIAYGFFMAGFPVGYTIGALLSSKLKQLNGLGVLFTALFIGGCTYLSLAFTPWYSLALVTEAIAGIVIAIFNIYNITLIQQRIPNKLMGKVTSVRLLIMRLMLPLGILFATIAVQILAIRTMYLIIGAIICSTSLAGYALLKNKEEIK
ncbi:Major Facilitator Superfamily protein [Psychrobacillus sp. OK028]|uniref:MFS transporter n=1 Tax=Psychrobacillus sp. OK028 TaxID=1884359 RepID=UPI00088942C9|nr:MFS transporter [Psychrobacillus sp. OK028]SDN48645.1 Major Facilitator Superfamily protein [Psychrobacillus sp. OK028]